MCVLLKTTDPRPLASLNVPALQCSVLPTISIIRTCIGYRLFGSLGAQEHILGSRRIKKNM